MSVDRLKRDFLDAAQKYKRLYKESKNPEDLDKFKRLMDIYFHLDDIADDEIQDLQSVTDVGNTTTNDLIVNGILSPYYLLDTNATPTPQQGMLFWDEDRSTVGLQMNGVEARLGQDNFWYVKNQTGSPIPKGTAVMAVGALGASSRILVAPMIADGSVDEQYFLGITAEEILNGEDGFVTNIGKIRGIDTSVYGTQAGQILYCDPANPGGFTITQPQAPNLNIPAAFTVDYKNNGTIAVRALPGYHLSELHDVYINTPSDQDILLYNGTNNRWENTPLASAVPTPTLQTVTDAGNTTTNAITVGGLVSSGTVDIKGNRIGRIANNQYIEMFGGTGEYRFVNGAGGGWFFTWCQNSGNATPPAEKMRLSTSNNLLIGTTTDSGYKLDVNGGNVRLKTSSSLNNYAEFVEGGSTGTKIRARSYAYGYSELTSRYLTLNGGHSIIGNAGAAEFIISSNLAPGATDDSPEDGAIVFRANNSGTNSGNQWSAYTNSTAFNFIKKEYAGGYTSMLSMNGATNNIGIGNIQNPAFKLQINGTLGAQLTNATQTDQVYYDSTTGELTYGAVPVTPTPTLQTVTDAGNTTTNDITVGGLTVDTDLIYTDTVNGRVGIGTNVPSQALQVGALSTSNTKIQVVSDAFSTTSGLELVRGSSIWNIINNGNFTIQRGGSTFLTVNALSNVLIGTTTDAGYKLDVNGSVKFGSGLYWDNTNNRLGISRLPTEDELEVNSSFRVGTSNGLRFRGGNLYLQGQTWTRSGAIVTASTSGRTEWRKSGSGSDFMVFRGDDCTNSGHFLDIYRNFTATSTENYNYIFLRPTINQGVSATGITKGLYINPTLTSAADWRSIEWSNNAGWGLYGAGTANNYLNGNLLIGTTTDAGYKLDVNGDVNSNGDYYNNGIQGYTGTVTIQQTVPNPPINVDVNGGIITNVY